MLVKNMVSTNGNKVPNQFEVHHDNAVFFQSYDSVIVKIDNKTRNVFLDEQYWDYSRTTGKYRNLFLGETIKETRSKIESGEYTLTNLN